MKIYKSVSLGLMLVFAAVGILFLSVPDQVLTFFNTLSSSFGMLPSPITGWSFYLILAAGYMYLVTVLAYLMFKNPENRVFPLLLVHAKIASSVLSLVFFVLKAHYLIFLANFFVDGTIGILVLIMRSRMREIA